ncbi:hypothetical protein [Rhizohabitans arisaemae]|uniref:hypothetical protein n=1 Tax=Rhizohabitans arisaemae TaxID=2720610 RepID=UPI0024B0F990|nr:hypothetical protein [Rhizohabitans arisaemae]
MTWLLITLFVLLAVIVPLLGADSRDSRDWQPDAFHAPRFSAVRALRRKPRPARKTRAAAAIAQPCH